jgi:hypothetical protein
MRHHTSATLDPATTPVVVACCRTAVGRSHPERGIFRNVRGDDLASAVVRAVVERSGVDPATIEDVLLGVTQQRGELGGNVARTVGLMAGLPFAAAGTTVNRLCGSSLQALAQACHAIAAGAENVQVVGGVEHMHHLPMESAIDIHPQAFARSSRGMLSMGLTAEQLASLHGIPRRRQEEYALASHEKAARADEAGLFDDELVRVFGHDEAGGLIEAVRENEKRAVACGYDVARAKLLVFVLSAGICGMAGALRALHLSIVPIDSLHYLQSGQAVMMCLLGGMGTFFGPFVGAAVFLYLEDVVTNLTRYWMGAVGLIFMVFVLFFPKGIWGTLLHQIERWQGRAEGLS